MRTWLYDVLRWPIYLYYRLLYGVRASGCENVPREGGFVLSANHVHVRDAFVLAVCCPKRRLHFMAKAELFENRLLGALIRAFGAFPVRRGESDLGAVRESVRLLSEGRALGIFPQGTRSTEQNKKEMETGVALIALRAGKGVVPAYIDGPYRLFGGMRVCIGPMVAFDDLGKKIDKATLIKATERVERAIWALKPAAER